MGIHGLPTLFYKFIELGYVIRARKSAWDII